MASYVQRGNKWLARVTRKGFPPQNKTFDSKAEAELWAVRLEAAMLGKEFVDTEGDDKMLVADLIDKLIEAKQLKTGKHRSEYYRLKAIAGRIGKYSVKNLTDKVISQYIRDRLEEVKPASVEREVNQLHGVFAHAIHTWKMKIKNPCVGVRRPKPDNRRDRILSDEQLALIFHELGAKGHAGRNPLMVPMAKLALETAMRRGEIHNLQNRTVYLPTTKNGDPRTVPLSSKAVAILDAVPRTDKKVFPKVSYEAFSGVWRRACERAGVEDFHYHDLRHMAITRMSKLLPNVIELSRVSGHRNLRNLDRYYHTTPEQLAAKLG
jgi:integrase